MYYKQCNINVSTFIGIPVYVKIVYPQTLACLAYLKKTTKKYLFAFLLTLSDAGFFSSEFQAQLPSSLSRDPMTAPCYIEIASFVVAGVDQHCGELLQAMVQQVLCTGWANLSALVTWKWMDRLQILCRQGVQCSIDHLNAISNCLGFQKRHKDR